MDIDRIRTVARVAGVLVFLLLGLALMSMHHTYSSIQRRQEAGGESGSYGEQSTARAAVVGAGFTEAQVLERLLGAGYTLQFRDDISGDDNEEIVASGGLAPGPEGVVVERVVVLSELPRGWSVLFDSANPQFWHLSEADRQGFNRQLGLPDNEDPSQLLAQQGRYLLDSLSPQRIVLEPANSKSHGLGPVITIDWDDRRSRYRPQLQSPGDPAE